MSGGQAEEKPLSVLPLPEVSRGRDGEGGGEDGLPEGPTGQTPLQAQESAGVAALAPRLAHHRPGPRPCGHQP